VCHGHRADLSTQHRLAYLLFTSPDDVVSGVALSTPALSYGAVICIICHHHMLSVKQTKLTYSHKHEDSLDACNEPMTENSE